MDIATDEHPNILRRKQVERRVEILDERGYSGGGQRNSCGVSLEARNAFELRLVDDAFRQACGAISLDM